MPFVERNSKIENKHLEELLDNPENRLEYERYKAEYEFRKQLYQARKNANLSQAEVAERSGLTQQSVSRIEKTSNATISSIIKYLQAVGAKLDVK